MDTLELYQKHLDLQDTHIKLLQDHLDALIELKASLPKDKVVELIRLAWATASAYGDKTNEADCMDWIDKNVLLKDKVNGPS